ncbi:MAG TPA: hypothetical protein VGB23_04190 [Nitrospirota bacterium]
MIDTSGIDRKFDAVQDTLAKLAMDMALLGTKVAVPREGQAQAAAPPVQQDISPELDVIKESLGRIEQEVSALRLGLTLLKEASRPGQNGQGGMGPEVQSALDEMRKEIKDAFEGQDKLLLSILAANREAGKANTDAHEKQEDALRYIAGNLHGDEKGGKKKWF